jgi:hypothetical protein
MKFLSGLLAFIFWERHPRHRHAITKLSLFKGKLMRVEKREFAWEFARQELYESYESLHESSLDCLSTRVLWELWEFAWEFSRLSLDKSCMRVMRVCMRVLSTVSRKELCESWLDFTAHVVRTLGIKIWNCSKLARVDESQWWVSIWDLAVKCESCNSYPRLTGF